MHYLANCCQPTILHCTACCAVHCKLILSLRCVFSGCTVTSQPSCILIFIFLRTNWRQKFCTEWQQAFPEFNLLWTSSWRGFWFVSAVPIYWTLPPFQTTYDFPCILISSHDHVLIIMSSPVSLIGNWKTFCSFLCSMYVPTQYIKILALNRNRCAPFNFKPFWFTRNLLKVYSKANLKSNCNKESSCFKYS